MDLSHVVGADLVIGPTGDLATADGPTYVQQRVLRRLMTNRGDDIWDPGYGGGLPSFVGMPVNAASLETAVRDQMLLEAAVARLPIPSVSVSSSADNTVTLTVTYSDATTGVSQTITLSPGF